MAGRRYAPNYKIINAMTKSFGSTGSQIKLARFKKIDAQSSQVTWLNNVNVSAMLQDGDGDNGGVMFYLTTNDLYDDNEIISSAAMPGFGGKVSLPAKRRIRMNEDKDLGDFGQVYLWGEITDLSYTSAVNMRIVIDTWGKNLIVDEL